MRLKTGNSQQLQDIFFNYSFNTRPFKSLYSICGPLVKKRVIQNFETWSSNKVIKLNVHLRLIFASYIASILNAILYLFQQVHDNMVALVYCMDLDFGTFTYPPWK